MVPSASNAVVGIANAALHPEATSGGQVVEPNLYLSLVMLAAETEAAASFDSNCSIRKCGSAVNRRRWLVRGGHGDELSDPCASFQGMSSPEPPRLTS